MSEESTIELTGLREDNPRDFLAALGLLRLLNFHWPDAGAGLGWTDGGAGRITLRGALDPGWSGTITQTLGELSGEHPSPVFHGPVIKTGPGEFRSAALRSLEFESGASARLPSLLYAAYSSQVVDEKGDAVEPSWFSFGNGQSGKNLLKDVAELICSLAPDDIGNTVVGGCTLTSGKSLRWCPEEFRPAAYRPHDPGSGLAGDEHRDHPALNVLAFIGLTFYPSVPTGRGGVTLGFVAEDRTRFFQWPIWGSPMESDEVFSFVCGDPADLRKERGVCRIWRARRFSAEKSLYFSNAVRVA